MASKSETCAILILAIKNINEIADSTENSSSSESDEDYIYYDANMERRKKIPRMKKYVENVVSVMNDDFKSHFRMRRDTLNYLLNLIRQDLKRKGQSGRHTINPEEQLLIAIWTFATPDSYRSVCDRFGIGRATALCAVRRVTKALVHIAEQHIKWPTDDEIAHTSAQFKARNGFPNIVGAIDGTHIKITAPKDNPDGYVNRKGFHSIQLQVVCDDKMKFIHCYVGHAGSVHDQRIFRLSDMHDICLDHNKFPGNTHIIGDAAYSIQQHLLTPYKDNGHLTCKQKNYNYCLSSARMVVERSLALLKGRFRSLLDKLHMTRTDLIPQYILACCVLHNICLLRNDNIEILILTGQNVEDAGNIENCILRNEGLRKRTEIMNNLPLRI